MLKNLSAISPNIVNILSLAVNVASAFSFSRFGFMVQTDRQKHKGGLTLYSGDDYRWREKNCRRVSFWGFAAHISRKKFAGGSAFGPLGA